MGRVEKAGEGYALKVEKRLGPGVMGSEQQTPIVLPGGRAVLAVVPNGEMVCMGLDGAIKWHSGAMRFGSGAYLVADGAAYVINDTGTLSTVAAEEGRYRLLGSSRVLADGQECWGPMALADGRLYVRDLTRLVCLDVRAR
jgi:outer membrane protein assembly factor BamB